MSRTDMKIARNKDPLAFFDRHLVEQAMENLAQALRVLEMVPETSSSLLPHPLVVVRAEIENARRYLRQGDRRPVRG